MSVGVVDEQSRQRLQLLRVKRSQVVGAAQQPQGHKSFRVMTAKMADSASRQNAASKAIFPVCIAAAAPVRAGTYVPGHWWSKAAGGGRDRPSAVISSGLA